MKVIVTTALFPLFPIAERKIQYSLLISKLNGNKQRKPKTNVAKRGYKHPFYCCFIFSSEKLLP